MPKVAGAPAAIGGCPRPLIEAGHTAFALNWNSASGYN